MAPTSKIPNFQPFRGDGRLACELDNRKFWQSRMTRDGNVARLPVLTDLEKLARDVRAANVVAVSMLIQGAVS